MKKPPVIRPFGVVTGASSGIGLELARQFCENGFDVLIVAENPGIRAAAEELSATGADVTPVQIDLAEDGAVEQLWQAVAETGRPLEAIAINAGVGVGGRFAETDLEAELKMIALNVTSSVCLAKKAVQDMIRRDKGRILITASVAAVMPTPYQTVYGATKAFLLSLSEGIRNELKDTNVTVTALMPGATETNFFHRAGLDNTKVGAEEKDDPADVAKDGFRAMMDGKDSVVAGSVKTQLMGWALELLPETVKAEMHAREARPGSARQ